MTLIVEPIYGNGWTDGHGVVPEPSAFSVQAKRTEAGAISGPITACDDARLVGATFEATPRHVALDAVYNCFIKCEEGSSLAGYCKIV